MTDTTTPAALEIPQAAADAARDAPVMTADQSDEREVPQDPPAGDGGMTVTRLRSAGRCTKCRTPMVTRPRGGLSSDLPDGTRYHNGRSLCTPCSSKHRHCGLLGRYPRRIRSRAEILAARAEFPDLTYAQLAAQLGMTRSAVKQALHRAYTANRRAHALVAA